VLRTVAATVFLLLGTSPARALLPTANASGAALYQRECAPCHGPSGHGDGAEAPSFVKPPRDLQAGLLARPPATQLPERIRRSRLRMLEIDAAAVGERRKQMAESIVGHLERLPDVKWPLVRRGADVYAERCESCHGAYARPVAPTVLQKGPRPSGAQPAPDFQKALGDADLLRIARKDHRALPGFRPLASAQDATALLAYLRLLSPGFARYSLWCAGCHGDEGRGDGVFATGIDQPNMVLDRAYLTSQSPAELRRKIMHVVTQEEPALPHFQRDLTDGQLRAIVAALRARSGAAPATPAPR